MKFQRSGINVGVRGIFNFGCISCFDKFSSFDFAPNQCLIPCLPNINQLTTHAKYSLTHFDLSMHRDLVLSDEK